MGTNEIVLKALDNISEEIMILSKDFRVLWCNRSLMEKTSLEERDIVGGLCHKVTHHLAEPCRPPGHTCPVRKVMEGGGPVTETHTHLDRDGNEYYVEVSAYPVTDSKGEITEFVHISRDVSDMVEREHTLRRARDFSNAVVMTMADSLIVTAPDSTIKSANMAACELLGYKGGELTGRPVADVIAEGDVFGKGKLHEQLMKDGAVKDAELTFVAREGERIPVNFSCSLLRLQSCRLGVPTDECPTFKKRGFHCPELGGIVGVAQDMRKIRQLIQKAEAEKRSAGELAQVAAQLELTRESFRNIVEKSANGIIVIDSDGVVRFVNLAAETLFNRKREEIIGNIFGFPLTTDKVTEIDIVRRDGNPGTGELYVSESQWEGRDAYLTSIYDITERKQAEELRAAVMESRRMDEAKDTLISNISHEMRTPLAIIKEAVALLLDEVTGKVNEEQRDLLQSGMKNIWRLSSIIGDLLDISKIESGRLEVSKGHIDISGLIRETLSEMMPLYQKKGVSLDYESSHEKTDAFIDGERIREVLMNLLSNALKFTHQGGFVKVICEDKAKEILISIQDSGVGIAREDALRVFDKFTQFGRETGPGEKGTGLGLAICKGIVELHKGRIWVESEYGKGSRFCISLPGLNPEELLNKDKNEQVGEADLLTEASS